MTLDELRELYPDALVFFSFVNEDGEKYGGTTELDIALRMLSQFPNDSIVISLEG